MDDLMPAEVFAPGEYLKDALDNMGWTQTEFAEMIGRPTRVINEIIQARRSVTPETARELAAGLGTSAQYWLNLESAYQLSRVPEANSKIERERALRERFPIREMGKRGWITPSRDTDALEREVFSYFGIKAANDPIQFAHAARRNEESDINELQWAWIFRVNQLASAIRIPPYSERALREALSDLEPLMMEPEGVRQIPRILAECGVRLIVVEPIPGSKIQGVCFWLEGKSPVIGLTLKGDFIDRFWFNLRHELEHVLSGDGKDAVITDDFEDSPNSDEADCEINANKAAAEFCVPQAALANFIARHHPQYSHTSLIGFSKIMRRHPGIVAGQLQRKLNKHDLFSKYKVRVRELFVQTALTDGYGKAAPLEL